MVNPYKNIFFLFFPLITLFYLVLNFGQVNEPKQITDFDFDSRNPVFLQYPLNLPWYNEETELFFEAVTDSLVSICSIKYDAVSDSFYQLNYISSNSNPNVHTINRNVNGKYIEVLGLDYKMLLWETNENGNWDIAFSIDSGNGWTPQSCLFSTPEDELSPSFILNLNSTGLLEIIYSRAKSVLLYSKDETEKTEVLFQGSDSVNYSYPTGAYSFIHNTTLYVVAVEENIREDPHLVYSYKSYGDTLWSDKQNIIENTPAIKPTFSNPDFEIFLSFEDYSSGLKKNLLIRPEDFGIPGSTISLIEDSTIESAEFSAHTYLIVTEGSIDDYYSFTPFVFRFRRNDSTFVRVGESENYQSYSDYYSKVTNSKPVTGPLSVIWQGAVAYAVWEDSSNGKINLFGVRRIDPLGEVEDASGIISDFSLSQNYPNPFNPTTIIRFTISDVRFTTLQVYDVLGREIATLVNEEKPSGSYVVEYSAEGLTSGIYFYQLRAGNFIETRKMILMK